MNELTTSNEDALSDYEAASTALDKVDVEKNHRCHRTDAGSAEDQSL